MVLAHTASRAHFDLERLRILSYLKPTTTFRCGILRCGSAIFRSNTCPTAQILAFSTAQTLQTKSTSM